VVVPVPSRTEGIVKFIECPEDRLRNRRPNVLQVHI